MEDAQRQFDTVTLIRVSVKIYSALNNLKELNHFKKYIKFNLKKEAKSWKWIIDNHLPELMDKLSGENDQMLLDIYKSFDSIDDSIMPEEQLKLDKRQLLIFYAKLKSVLIDFSLMSNVDMNVYLSVINQSTLNLATQIENQYPFIKEIEDDGDTIDDLIKYINKYGLSIISYEKID